MNYYDIWSEGYATNGERGTATYMGSAKGNSFKEACIKYFKDDNTFNPESMTYWGCRLYENEGEARKSFG